MVMVDGKLCDGALKDMWGWQWLAATQTVVAGGTSATLAPAAAPLAELRLYSRALLTSELVGNYRAGPSADAY